MLTTTRGHYFPLTTNKIILEHGSQQIGDFIYQKISHSETAQYSFLPQERAYAAKHRNHLRRTVKLDPIAEFFIYEIVYRHRSKFRADVFSNRQNFGFRFNQGAPISASEGYLDFKSTVQSASQKYRFSARFDISSYFNSIYHHDLSRWFSEIANQEEDTAIFGKFLRQINSGRSIDCLTQGIMPTKILGANYLKFVDNYPRIESEVYLRFMDDFYLFSNDENKLNRDFILIQRLLGEKGLSINPAKTEIGETADGSIDTKVDAIRSGLLRRRRRIIRSEYFDDIDDDDDTEDEALNPKEEHYLLSLLNESDIEEEDAELVLSFFREKGDYLLDYLKKVLWMFPYLAKNVYVFCNYITDKEELLNILIEFVENVAVTTEYPLFWIGKITEDYLLDVAGTERLITALYEHPSGTKISKAKLLEIRDSRYGLRELREENLRSGSSDWLSWSSAVGSIAEPKASRNHILGYFANCSEINRIFADIIKEIE